MTITYDEFLRQVPKAELHVHLESTMRPGTALELADTYGVTLFSDDPATLYNWYPDASGIDVNHFFFTSSELVDFLKLMGPFLHITYSADDFARIVYETLEDEKRNGNLRYREMYFSPLDHLVDGVTYATMADGLIEGVRAARTDLGVDCRLVAGINRKYGPDAARELAEMMATDPRDEIIGIGLDALTDDRREAPERYVETYAIARKAGLHRTAHVAENADETAANIAIALDELHCERIDHGYQIVHAPDMIQRCLDEGIAFCCSTSATLPTFDHDYGWGGLRGNPVRTMIDAGLTVTLSTDSTCFPGSDLGSEYARGIQGMALSPDEARTIVMNGLDVAWLDAGERAALVDEFTREIDALEAQLDRSTIPT